MSYKILCKILASALRVNVHVKAGRSSLEDLSVLQSHLLDFLNERDVVLAGPHDCQFSHEKLLSANVYEAKLNHTVKRCL